MCRSPKPEEQEDIQSMQRNAEVLEFFEDFYAGFLQILLQLYILMLQLAKTENFTTQVRKWRMWRMSTSSLTIH